MAVILRELVRQVHHMDFRLVAGEKGLDHVVRWLHMVDNAAISDFLEGGEIAFTTGIGLSDKETLYDLVVQVYRNHASGMVINLGPYIKEITPDIISFADENDFPVFAVPWKVHMAEIMRIFSFSIIRSEQEMMQISTAFENAFLFPEREELYVASLIGGKYMPNWNYAVVILNIFRQGKCVSKNRTESVYLNLSAMVMQLFEKATVISLESGLIIVFADCKDEEIRQHMRQLEKTVRERILMKDEHLQLSAGRNVNGIRTLHESYQSAYHLSRLQMNIENKNQDSLMIYAQMGIYKLLMEISDQNIIKEYLDDILQPVLDYDTAHGSNLADTLHCYMQHNGSVKETAEELFVHRNTINYQIEKAEELLECDLSTTQARTRLSIAFMLQNMYTL